MQALSTKCVHVPVNAHDYAAKIQQCMIDSQKLLDPYLNMDTLSYMELPTEQTASDDNVNGHILDQNSRQRYVKERKLR